MPTGNPSGAVGCKMNEGCLFHLLDVLMKSFSSVGTVR